MPDLSNLDPNQPDGSVIRVNQLDDFIREDRAALKGWALVEHHENGWHKFGVGTDSERIAAFPSPRQGNVWIFRSGTVYQFQVFDNGAWRNIS